MHTPKENKKSEKTFGAQKKIRDVENLGWIRVRLGKEKSHPLFNFLAFTLKLSYKNNITLHIHTYIFIYISLPL